MSGNALRPCHQLENVSAGIVKVDAPAAVPVVELSVPIPWVAAERESRLPHPLQNGVELLVAHMKRIVMSVEILGIVKIERQRLIDADWRKVTTLLFVLQPKDLREKARRGLLVARRHDRVIQRDGHLAPRDYSVFMSMTKRYRTSPLMVRSQAASTCWMGITSTSAVIFLAAQ